MTTHRSGHAHPTTEQLTAFARGDLTDRVAGELAWHLDDCPRCAGLVRHVDPLHRTLASVPDPTLPDLLLSELLAEARAPGAAQAPVRPWHIESGAVATGVTLWVIAGALAAFGAEVGSVQDVLRVLRAMAIAAAHLLDGDAARSVGVLTLAVVVAVGWMVRPRHGGGSRSAGGGW